MPLQIAARQIEDVLILDVSGRVLIGQTSEALNSELRKHTEAGSRKVLVNLEGVEQMDSSGISTLVRTYISLEKSGGAMKLLRPIGRVRDVLEITRLIKAIPTFDDESSALASFSQATHA
jgi:anti-anti-sigma factor